MTAAPVPWPAHERAGFLNRLITIKREWLRVPRAGGPRFGQPPAPGLTARDVMSRLVVSVRAEAALAEVAQTMLAQDLGCVLVVDADGALQGIITESDFTVKARPLPFSTELSLQLFGEWLPKHGIEGVYAHGRELSARQVMSAPVVTVAESTPVDDIVQLMHRRSIARVPVMRAGEVRGMVTRHDLLKLVCGSAHPAGLDAACDEERSVVAADRPSLDQRHLGYRVVTQDGEDLGTVKEIRSAHFKVDAPLRRDYWLAAEYVRSIGDQYITLNVDLDHLGKHMSLPPPQTNG